MSGRQKLKYQFQQFFQSYKKKTYDRTRSKQEIYEQLGHWTDAQILIGLPEIPVDNRAEVAQFLFLQGRLSLMKKWWQKGKNFQFSNQLEWQTVILSLLPIVRQEKDFFGDTLKKPSDYQQRGLDILCTFLACKYLHQYCRQEWQNYFSLPLVTQLLVYLASSLPHGLKILANHWSQAPEDIWNLSEKSVLFTFNITQLSFIEREKNIHNNFNTFCRVLRFGHPSDLDFFWSRPESWCPNRFSKSKKPKWPCLLTYNYHEQGEGNPFTMASLNRNPGMLKKYLSLMANFIEGLRNSFNDKQLITKILSYSELIDYYQPESVILAIQFLDNHYISSNFYQTKNHRYALTETHYFKRVQQLINYCQLVADDWPSFQEADFQKKLQKPNDYHFSNLNLETIGLLKSYSGCTYEDGLRYQLPVVPRPEQLIALGRQGPWFYTPKADGVTFQGYLPDNCYPEPLICSIRAEKLVDFSLPQTGRSVTLYLVFDVVKGGIGNWYQRLQLLGQESGLFKEGKIKSTVDWEWSTFQQFLMTLDQQSEIPEAIWWPKMVYQLTDFDELLTLVSQPPNTPYPNDGWIMTGLSGGLYKIKTAPQLTLDLEWPLTNDFITNYNHHNLHYTYSNMTPLQYLSKHLISNWEHMFPIGFLESTPINHPQSIVKTYQWDTQQQRWTFLKKRSDKKKGNCFQVYQLLTEYHLAPWQPKDLIAMKETKNLKPFYYRNKKCLERKIKPNLQRYNQPYNIGGYLEVGHGYQYPHYQTQMIMDIDPDVINYQLQKGDARITYLWLDAVTFRNPLTGRSLFESTINLPNCLSFQFSFHYCLTDAKKANMFKKNLLSFTEIYIEGYALESLKGQPRLKFEDQKSYLQVVSKSTWHPKLYWAERYLHWHDLEPTLEILVTTEFLIEFLSEYKLNIHYDHCEHSSWLFKQV